MAYCTVDDLRRMLPETVRIGDLNIGVAQPQPGRPGNQGSNRSNISPDQAEYYIEYASSVLDGKLRPFYICPLRRIKSYETEALLDIAHGTNITVTVNDSGAFIRGETVRIQDVNTMETSVVLDTPTIKTLRLVSVINDYSATNNTRISVIEYPDPVPLIVSQLACGLILDRLFVSEQSPDSSNYSKTMRNLARAQIESILSGETLLTSQDQTGRRFIRTSLLDKWSSPAGDIQKGSENE